MTARKLIGSESAEVSGDGRKSVADCQFCSQVSKANGEDPIGSAGTADFWLLIELKQPWTEALFHEDPRIAPLVALFRTLILRHGITVRPVLLAPDREYSRPRETRVIYYARPQQQFAQFTKQEFVVPEIEFPRLVTALLKRLLRQPHDLAEFDAYRRDTNQIREMLVCTHGNVDAACARFGSPIYQQLRTEYAPRSAGGLRVWRCSHFGGHKFAPTLLDFPDGRCWGHLEPAMLDGLIERRGSLTGVRSHYRGWAGLSKFEQIAEREIWLQEGWEWLDYYKSGRTTRKGLTGIKSCLYWLLRRVPLRRVQFFVEQWTQDASWAEVQIQFTSPDRSASGSYHARVEQSGQVMTAAKSAKLGEEIELQHAPQYRVSYCVRTQSS